MQNKYKNKISIIQQLSGDIITCQLKPGTQIREAQACARYRTSRTPVREALVELAAKGFVILEQNKGAIVAPLDTATVFAVFEARIPAEKAAASLSAVRATGHERQALEVYKQELLELDPDRDADNYFAIDRAIHQALSNFSRNPYIASQIENLRDHTARCWHYYKERGLREEADIDGLVTILDAVISNDPQAAAEAMRIHLGGYVSAYREMLTEQIETLKWV
ncbi:hypothetical protein MNBD_ALPHA08-89 [hydrothermal vent metagenome]|uniref:HTH gntR-type domain-containing protein n=1 Tax=hydrothermal vent metagenome TaxID=652676 RepID=A0A3B0SC05_9ZZZZ